MSDASHDLAAAAQRHLWMHFTRLTSAPPTARPDHRPWRGLLCLDHRGRRYLDALSGLFTVQVGHGREELAEAAAAQTDAARLFPDLVIRPRAGDRARRTPRRRCPWRPQPCVLHTVGWRCGRHRDQAARQYFKLHRRTVRTKVISRTLAYHGTSMGALSVTGVAAIKAPFEPLMPGSSRSRLPTASAASIAPPRCLHAALRRRRRAADRDGGSRDGRRGVHGARPEHGRRVRSAATAT